MEPQQESLANQAPDSHVNLVDGSQQDHVMTSPRIEAFSSNELPDMEDDTTGIESHNYVGDGETPAPVIMTSQPCATANSSDLPAVSNYTINEEIEMEDAAPLRKTSHNSTSLAPILPRFSNPPEHDDSHGDKMDLDSYIAAQKDCDNTGSYPTTPRHQPKSFRTPTLSRVLTPRQVERHGGHVTTSTVTQASTFCNPSIGEGIPSAPKRRWSPSLLDDLADQLDASVPTDIQREYVFSNLIDKLTRAWRDVLELYGMRLGLTEAFNTPFVPDVDTIRENAMRWWAPLDEIADATESELLEQWQHRCRRVIRRYQTDMRRDLVAEARAKARGIRDQVLASAALIRDQPTSNPDSPRTPARLRIPSTPASRSHMFALPLSLPNTPDSKKRPAPLDVDALRSHIEGLSLGGVRANDGNGFDNPRTPTSTKRFKRNGLDASVSREPLALPKGLTTPARRRVGFREIPPLTPTRPWRRARVPTPRAVDEGEEDVDMEGEAEGQVVGHIGPYPVMEPPSQVEVEDEAEAGTDSGAEADVSGEGDDEEEEEGGDEEESVDGDGDEDEDMEDGDDVFTSCK
ncbi:uncharacterized protein GGS22DRAFT_28216 [Annulohypoxylon maeteangense]|uniref:uncharacterized protein n=1 Tax=Annulohypoxylon maeteangense TaxID=1927788 RepID=UPI002008E717|nr:uncharacterized protein GGS22DRAFT_28216 [Annulohypoxylon maeteangense]KAI0883971.1 hypothetical protein GGS22DRAFT_28216 [Annulohypoxylon maeteangense]